MNEELAYFIFGFIIGCFILYIFDNIMVAHGPDSNIMREIIFNDNGVKYKFVPRIIK